MYIIQDLLLLIIIFISQFFIIYFIAKYNSVIGNLMLLGFDICYFFLLKVEMCIMNQFYIAFVCMLLIFIYLFLIPSYKDVTRQVNAFIDLVLHDVCICLINFISFFYDFSIIHVGN
jgi:hypothetical protein